MIETLKTLNLKLTREAVQGIDLSEQEEKFLEWLAVWDEGTNKTFASIVQKAAQKL